MKHRLVLLGLCIGVMTILFGCGAEGEMDGVNRDVDAADDYAGEDTGDTEDDGPDPEKPAGPLSADDPESEDDDGDAEGPNDDGLDP